MIFMGIDPGGSGAIGWVEDGRFLDVEDMPYVNKEIPVALLKGVVTKHEIQASAVERVHSMPGNGRATMFKFGTNYGMALMGAGMLDVPMYNPTPNEWKKSMRLSSDKEAARLLALKLFPEAADLLKFKTNEGRAEALLIALWLERTWRAQYAAPRGTADVPRLRLVRRGR